MKKKTNDEFIREATEIHGNKYDYSKVVYNGIFNKVTIICHIHGEFQQTARDHLRGHGCVKCSSEKLGKHKTEKAKADFIKKATEKTKGKYDLSEVEYVNAKTHIKVICHEKDICGNEHGAFYITPSNLLSLYGCPKCGKISSALNKRLPYEKFQGLVDEKYGNGTYTVDRNSYNTNQYEIKVHCNIHDVDFFVNTRTFPRNNISKCPSCIKDIKLTFETIKKNKKTHQVDTDTLQQPELDEKIKIAIENGEEVWVPVKGHNRYMVSSEGRIKIINRISKSGNPLPDYLCSPNVNRNKRRVSISIDGQTKSVHKTVFESFYNIDIPKGYEYTIDHIDTNPLNNSLINLRLCRGIADNVNNNPLTKIHLCRENKNKGKSLLFDIHNIEGETWKPCYGYEGLYSVSNYGRVKAEKRIIIEKNTDKQRTKRPHLMKLYFKDERSYVVGLVDLHGHHKNHFVHRLEYESFYGKIPDGFEIDHIDSNPQNNILTNLRACTHIENSNNPNSKKKRKPPTKKKGVSIKLVDNTYNTMITFNSMTECAKYLNIDKRTVRRIVMGLSTGKKVFKNGEKLIID